MTAQELNEIGTAVVAMTEAEVQSFINNELTIWEVEAIIKRYYIKQVSMYYRIKEAYERQSRSN